MRSEVDRIRGRYEKLAEGMQAKIHRQTHSIDRMSKALTKAQRGLEDVLDSESIEEARTIAANTSTAMAEALKKPGEGEAT